MLPVGRTPRSRVPERRRRGGEVGADETAQGVRPDGRGDGVPAAADGEQVAVVDLGRAGGGGERAGGAAAEGASPASTAPRARPAPASASAPAAGAATPASPRAAASPKPSPTSTTAVASRSIDSDRSHASAASGDSAGPVTDAPDRRRRHARDNGRVTFTRIAWLVTVAACVVTGVALLVSGYQGYAAVFGAVGACAAINLR